MKPNHTKLLLAVIAVIVGAGAAYGSFFNQRTPVEFYVGHSHLADGTTINAPQHSGGTDAMGCHNASVPYHCH
jgi:hypothetical protein